MRRAALLLAALALGGCLYRICAPLCLAPVMVGSEAVDRFRSHPDAGADAGADGGP